MSSIIECEKCGFDTFAVQDDGVMICHICGEDSTTVPINAELRKMVLDLCRLTILNGAIDGIITAAMEEMAAKICERLEAGE